MTSIPVRAGIDPDEEIVIANSLIASSQLEALRRYLETGRRYRDLDAETLQKSFVLAFQGCASAPGNSAVRSIVEDVMAEFDLRGEEIPFHLVKTQVDAIVAWRRGVIDQLTPAQRQKADAGLLDEYRRSVASRN